MSKTPPSRHGTRGRRLGLTAPARRGILGTFLLVAVLLSGACSSKPQVCSDLEQLQSSVQALKDVNLTDSGSLSTLQTDLATVQTDFTAVKSSADQAVGSEVSAMGSSLQTLKQAAQAAVASPGASTIGAVATAVGATQTSFNALKSAVPDC